ncbi:hypothetical protein Q5P01_019998 [Channa striata]|uniref:Uncharacterized protein n=1 Tax=Channa striata TaxID=64152 RepID=A0AA88LWS3_CHASR|nr:hypothetical protein Q5P01_019998 [Channa striata]
MQSVEARPYPHQILRERSSRRPRENKRAASIRVGPSPSCTSASSDEEGSDEGERKKKRGGSRSGSTEAPKRGAPRAKKRDASEGPPSPRHLSARINKVSPHTYSDGCGPENPGSHGQSKDAGSDGEESGPFDQRESTREERGRGESVANLLG